MDWPMKDAVWSTCDLNNYMYDERHTVVIRKMDDEVSDMQNIRGTRLTLIDCRRFINWVSKPGRIGGTGSKR